MLQRRRQPSTQLKIVLIGLFILGSYFRFVNLDLKMYWQDEIATSLRISGFSLYKLYQQAFTGDLIGVEQLNQYIGVSPDRNIIEVAKAFIGNPEHTPLYYLLARFWIQIFDYSVGSIRALSAILSLLSFPVLYWLCLEIFESSLVGWVAIALLSVSPLHVLYAQEARPYSLWIFTIFLTSATLLRAMRLNTKTSWGIYAIALASAYYTHIFSGLILLIHLTYVMTTNKFRFNPIFKRYIIASTISLIAFLPWILIIIWQRYAFQANTSWASESTSLLIIFKRLFLGLISIFFDPNGSVFWQLDRGLDNSLLFLTRLPLLLLIGYAVYFTLSKSSKKASLFIGSTLGVSALVIILPSLLLGLTIAGKTRYQLVLFLGIQLAVSYAIATKMQSMRLSKRHLWKGIFFSLIAVGIMSCTVSSKTQAWWNKEESHTHLQIAKIINQTERPLVISNEWVSNIFALSHLLENKATFQLFTFSENLEIAEEFTDIFLFKPSKQLLEKLAEEQQYEIYPVSCDDSQLWKLAKRQK